jgi:hypothetical protein
VAEVYRTIRGRELDDYIAHRRDVREAIRDEAHRRGEIAKSIHPHDEYHSFIEVKRYGKLDWWVVLNDTRGLSAAMSIEFGRGPDENGKGATSGAQTLHRAFELDIERTFPRSKRRKRFNDRE